MADQQWQREVAGDGVGIDPDAEHPQAAGLGDRNKGAEMAEIHAGPMLLLHRSEGNICIGHIEQAG